MANICNYEVHVKGSKSAALMVYHSMPCMEEKDIIYESGSDNAYEIHFTGDCKWSVNYGVSDSWNKGVMNLSKYDEDEIIDLSDDYWEVSLRAKSEAFNCEILVHYWSSESEFDQFDHYKNGKCLKQRKIAYSYDEDNEFDWKTTEFVGHEGEYDNSVDGEESDAAMMNMLQNVLGGAVVEDDDEDDTIELTDELADIFAMIAEIKKEVDEMLPAEAPIGNTKYDLYNWTFTEGKTVGGNGWKIAIPDGFVKTGSDSGRAFELVPQGYQEDDTPVTILAGTSTGQQIGQKDWPAHPYAREGVALLLGANMAEQMNIVFGHMMELRDVLSVEFEDICAYILVGYGGGAYHIYPTVITGDKSQQLRIQATVQTDEQMNILKNSVINWVRTFRFDKANPFFLKNAPIEKASVLTDILNGKTKSFEDAVDKAATDYLLTITPPVKTVFLLSDCMDPVDFDENEMRDRVLEALNKGMAVKEFHYEKIDAFVEKIRGKNVDSYTLKKIYDKLQKFVSDDQNPDVEWNGEKLKVRLADKILKIREKWDKHRQDIESKIKSENAERDIIKLCEEVHNEIKKITSREATAQSLLKDVISEKETAIKNFKSEINKSLQTNINSRYIDKPEQIADKFCKKCVEIAKKIDRYFKPSIDVMSHSLMNRIVYELHKLVETSSVNIKVGGTSIHKNVPSEILSIENFWKSKLKNTYPSDYKYELLRKYRISETEYDSYCNYINLVSNFSNAKNIKEFKDLKTAFTEIKDFPGSQDYIKKCDDEILQIQREEEARQEGKRIREEAQKRHQQMIEESIEKAKTDKYTALNKKKEKLLDDIQCLKNEEADQLSKINDEIYSYRTEIDNLFVERGKLGLLKSKQKKAIDLKIEALRNSVYKSEADIADTEKKYHKKANVIESDIASIDAKITELNNNACFVNKMLKLKENECIVFGKEYHSHGSVPMNWKVLKNEGNKLTLIAKKAVHLCNQQDCDKMLAGDFVAKVFTQSEAKVLLEFTRNNKISKSHLPTEDEFKDRDYFQPSARMSDKYEESYIKSDGIKPISRGYWISDKYGAFLNHTQSFMSFPSSMANECGVRPVIMIDLDKLIELI